MWRNLAAAFAACRRYLPALHAGCSFSTAVARWNGTNPSAPPPFPPHIISVTVAGFRIGDEDHWRFYHRPLSAIEPSTRGRLIQQPFQKRVSRPPNQPQINVISRLRDTSTRSVECVTTTDRAITWMRCRRYACCMRTQPALFRDGSGVASPPTRERR